VSGRSGDNLSGQSFDAFRARIAAAGATAGALVPLWRDVLLDNDTAVAAFHRLRQGPFAFLLESAPAGSETWARYTFLGTTPRAAWRISDGTVETWSAERGWHGARRVADPFADLRALVAQHPPIEAPELGAVWGGAVGFFAYDMVRHIERLPAPPARGIAAPDAVFLITGTVVIVDNLHAQARVVASVVLPDVADERALRAAHTAAVREIDETVARLRNGPALPPLELADGAAPATGASNLSKERFLEHVATIKEHIVAGDVFQCLLARRITVPRDFDGTALYRAIRALNPSPYMYHLVLDGVELVGSSPELLVRVRDGRVVVRPIAGTRPRGATAAEDAAQGAELLADPKERAEHIMLVDLHRNDVGRVSKVASVTISDVMTVERYSHVMHITSNVTGELAEGMTAFDALRVSLPVGTVSGAPKVRAMQIIDELEPTRRGPYGGAVGYVDFAGNMDTCIALRTIVWKNGVFDVQAGAGVVADSIPAAEYEETMNKAKAMLKAVEIAEKGF
jgi:anthranilate synthase component 1